MNPKNVYLKELGQFLQVQRARISPEQAGLTAAVAARRRVSGLRREEIADQVSISTNYYARIEQGRMAPSLPVLEAIADALHLTGDQRAYVQGLAHQAGIRTTPWRPPASAGVASQIRRLLDQLSTTPAMVLGRHLSMLAWNAPMAAVLPALATMAPREANYARLVFTVPEMRTLFPDWEAVARTCVAVLRMEATAHPDDPELLALRIELSQYEDDFTTWWADRHVSQPSFGCKSICHPDLGEITFDWSMFRDIAAPSQRLALWSAADDGTREKLRTLTSKP
ncbi:helix-turn-helix domain-containing protein [Mycobacterium sp. MYCO198283]|uniref:helix-turn-helix domain-containing protein n=1 Tax=Mycobacterium sp. MYCO198283 TaxID=2883505 RepID=UPI001E43299D|nr:helix-turn-helix domain-containing protein [Mycobacterium sp. MYCO198283]MCG5432155.1 helix-turn-helix domain-containing protein [Mycobacterium sp. MYCO198283]